MEKFQKRFSKYAKWIKDNGKKYNGNWIVLNYNCELIGYGKDPTNILKKAWSMGIDQPFLHYIDYKKNIDIL